MKRRILHKLKITEVSAVDRPCMEHARMVIMKRDVSVDDVNKEASNVEGTLHNDTYMRSKHKRRRFVERKLRGMKIGVGPLTKEERLELLKSKIDVLEKAGNPYHGQHGYFASAGSALTTQSPVGARLAGRILAHVAGRAVPHHTRLHPNVGHRFVPPPEPIVSQATGPKIVTSSGPIKTHKPASGTVLHPIAMAALAATAPYVFAAAAPHIGRGALALGRQIRRAAVHIRSKFSKEQRIENLKERLAKAEDIVKFNSNHGAKGRFTSSSSGGKQDKSLQTRGQRLKRIARNVAAGAGATAVAAAVAWLSLPAVFSV